MKPIRSTLLGLLLTLCCMHASAQATNRPKLFDRFPNHVPLSIQTFNQAFDAREGQEVIVSFSPEFQFSGTVLSNEMKYGNLQTVLIKSPEFQQAIFSISMITGETNTITYTGRIIHPGAEDGYMLKNEAGQYSLSKISTDSVLQDCSYQ